MFVEIDILETLRSVKKRWKLILSCGLFGVLAGSIASTLFPSYWTATAKFTLVDESVSTKLKATEIGQIGTWYKDTSAPVHLNPEGLRYRFSNELQDQKNHHDFAIDFLRNSGIQNQKLPEQSSELAALITRNLTVRKDNSISYSVQLTTEDPRLAETLLKLYLKFATQTLTNKIPKDINWFLEKILKKLELESLEKTQQYISKIDEILLIQESIETLKKTCRKTSQLACAEQFTTQELLTEIEQLLTDDQEKFKHEIIERGMIAEIRKANARVKHVQELAKTIDYDEIKPVIFFGDHLPVHKSGPNSLLIIIITASLGLVLGCSASLVLEAKVTRNPST